MEFVKSLFSDGESKIAARQVIPEIIAASTFLWFFGVVLGYIIGYSYW
jgi:hypothetical protein